MSLLKKLERTKLSFFKKTASAAEAIDLAEFLTPEALKAELTNSPFPYLSIDNMLLPHQYENLEKQFKLALAKGLTKDTNDRRTFHAFDIDYDGYKYIPKVPADTTDPLHLFFSVAWNMFFSNKFTQLTTLDTSIAFHHHPPGDRTGFIHHDFVDKHFDLSTRLPNLVIPHATVMVKSAEDKRRIVPERRIISIIYYLANEPWEQGMGGETGFYTTDNVDAKPVASIAPVNNRLLAFHISKHSFHAFQRNLQQRNCIVQWFHLPSGLL